METTPQKYHIIFIDDSKLDCFIAERLIGKTRVWETVHSFLRAMEALNFLREKYSNDPEFFSKKTVLFVDIQMPLMNGYEFVEAFQKLPNEIISQCYIIVVDSSINERDLAKVLGYPGIRQFLNKPLTQHNLEDVVSKLS